MNVRLSTPRLVAIGCVDGVALARFVPDWRLLGHRLESPHDWMASSSLDGAAATLAGVALWCVGAWLAVGLLATVFALLPGQLGAAGSSFAERLLPSMVLRALAGAAGLSVLLAPVAAGAKTVPAATPPSGLGTQQSAPTPAWPTDSASAMPSTSWPSPPTTPPLTTPPLTTPPVTALPKSPAPPRPSPGTGSTSTPANTQPVVVRPGDSLWLIAAHRLAPGSGAGQIAAEWPRWYTANRSAIGPDPSVIRPGQVLYPPAAPHLQPSN